MGVDLPKIKAGIKLEISNERFEMISAATNDAVFFEVNLITGESWNNRKHLLIC
jgi:hypothetical protein